LQLSRSEGYSLHKSVPADRVEQVHLALLFAIRGEEPTGTRVTSEADDQIDVTAANVVTDIPDHSGS